MSSTGQCLLACIPVRAEGRSQAEIVTQVLYGETYIVLESLDEWVRIKMDYDDYEGWISRSQYHEIQFSPKSVQQTDRFAQRNGQILPLGSELQEALDSKSKSKFELAQELLGSPYLWGGRTFMGIDCSGFVQVVHKAVGLKLPRDASQQVTYGQEVEYGNQLAGDLAFFKSKSGKVTHVGLMLNEKEIIHAAGQVRIDTCDSKGIYDGNIYTHDFHSFRRL